MPFSVSLFEIAFCGSLGTLAMVLQLLGHPTRRWFLAATTCSVLGAILSPADILSGLLLSVALMCAYVAGTHHDRKTQSNTPISS